MKNLNIPEQIKGSFHDTVSMYCENTLESAVACYEKLQIRLKSINEWHTFSDKVKAKFTLFNPITKQPAASLEVGNLVRIDIPGIGSPSGNGYDWTEIIDIQTGTQDYPFFLFTLRPCAAPGDPNNTIAHFYTDAATNTFVVRQLGNCIYAEVHGRNEIENTSDVPLLDLARNKTVAVGSKLGIGNVNWLGFTKALLEPFKE